MDHDRIAVVDFGGQFAHLIATKVRRLRVLSEILQPEDPLDSFKAYKGIIFSGSPALASQSDEAEYDPAILDLPTPILGFCYGHQEIAKHYGGEVEHTGREYGFANLNITRKSPIFDGLEAQEQVWMSHGDSVTKLPEGFVELGYSTLGEDTKKHRNSAIADENRRRYGFQFHPEVDDTTHGDQMISNFVLGICGCKPTWTTEKLVQEKLEEIRRQVGDRKVFLLVSGGVDSTVAAKLLGDAGLRDRLHTLHIDNGLMRKDESAGVVESLKRYDLARHLHFVDATDRFLGALAGETDPEKKRHIIGTTFIEVADDEAAKFVGEDFLLAQGTIYPDTIETGGTKRADVIKTHHNRVPLVEEWIQQGRVIEPIQDLYKEEVREVGASLGIEPEAISRHPFPGPGLGVRVLCAKEKPADYTPEPLNKEINEILGTAGLEGCVLPIKSVGVKADLRSFELPVMMWGDRVSRTKILEAAARLPREVKGLNRVIWSLSGPPSGEPELHPATLTRDRLDLLREIDDRVMGGLAEYGIMDTIWQCPTVLLPISLGGPGRELVVLRPVHSRRAMTAIPADLPSELVRELLDFVQGFTEVSGLCLDVTTKPPGTIEWE